MRLIVLYFLISIALALAYVWLIHFYVKGWLKTPHQNTKQHQAPTEGFTIIVSVRNEAENIEACLKSLLNQNYPKSLFEIIVVNDFSTDDTLELLDGHSSEIHIINLAQYLPERRKNLPNKKEAISLAVSKAKYDLILCADGDCLYGLNWILSLEQYYKKYKKQFVAAPVTYIKHSSLFNGFLQLDLMAMIGITAGSIGQKRPLMASGANMMFTKSVFQAVDGYKGNEHIPSGDDVYLMQKIFKKNKKAIGFVKNTEAIVATVPPKSFKEFINQRIRWASKSTNMIDKRVSVISLLNYLFYLNLFLSLFILPFFNVAYLAFGLVMLTLKMLIDILFFSNIAAFFNKSSLLKWLIITELLHIFYVSFMGVFALVGSYKWKGRVVHK